ncbi:hypothetical protein K1T71_002615 [Dendrolimus kikuchii]|uniref:Uncharacterized protein n=1 Tax=Dendrolimus kikuchii TaxID=765133 RepID=A0ACC1DD65_9NEOP|nr:hypothetical protein K1T71_002615 [Dendrolimus kikuchii]
MGFKEVTVIIFIVFTISCVLGSPRDIVFSNENVNDIDGVLRAAQDPSLSREAKVPGRISCQHVEATEDPVCQNHCLPKGYSYGICVSNTCSCV